MKSLLNFNFKVLFVIVENQLISVEILSELSSLALSSNTDIEILRQLFDLDIDKISLSLARNLNIDKELFFKLAECNNFEIKKALVQHPKVPTEILDLLVDRRDLSPSRTEELNLAIVCHLNISMQTLSKLAGSKSLEVRQEVRRHPHVTRHMIDILDFIDELPGTSVKLLEELACDRRPHILQLVTIHPNSSAKALELAIQNTDDEQVWIGAGSHPHATTKIVEDFACFFCEIHNKKHAHLAPDELDNSEEVLMGLLKLPNLTERAIESIVTIKSHKLLRKILTLPIVSQKLIQVIYRIICDRNFYSDSYRLEFLNNIHIPDWIILEIFKDELTKLEKFGLFIT